MSPELSIRARRADVDAIYQESSDWMKAAGPATDLVAAVRKMVDRLADRGLDLTGLRQVPTLAGGVPAEWLIPLEGASDVRLVYLHGGGWVSGNIATSRARGAELARLSGASVLVIDYRLAPENPFPAGLEDSLAALDWVFTNGPDGADQPGCKRPTVSLLGESAGAGLAASVCGEALRRGRRAPDQLVLLSPQLSVAPIADRVGRDDPLVSQDKLWVGYSVYTNGAVSAGDPRVSPLFTEIETLRRFPPTFIQVSGDEIFLHDARILEARLNQVDVRRVLSVWPGLPHSWHANLDALPDAREALREVAAFVAGTPARA